MKHCHQTEHFKLEVYIDLIHKWLPIHYSFVLVQISLPSLTLEQEFFSNVAHDNEAW